MIRRGLPIRIYALAAAYALVLHAVLASMALSAHMPGNVHVNNAVICASSSADDQPAGQDQGDHSPCMLQCLIAGCTPDGLTPAASATLVIFTPADVCLSLLQPIEKLGRTTAKSPQIPRAPPLA